MQDSTPPTRPVLRYEPYRPSRERQRWWVPWTIAVALGGAAGFILIVGGAYAFCCATPTLGFLVAALSGIAPRRRRWAFGTLGNLVAFGSVVGTVIVQGWFRGIPISSYLESEVLWLLGLLVIPGLIGTAFVEFVDGATRSPSPY